MEFTNEFVFFAGLLLLLSIVATVPADRSGVPLLLVFLVIGMLAGDEGLGGIAFDDVSSAHLLGTTALAVILFDGGLHTPLSSFRTGLASGLALATLGVLATAGVTAAGVVWLFGAGWVEALLLAAIISSTDAAAVFYLLRARGLELHPRVRNTLEIESGVNDPMAIFLTLALIEWQLADHAAPLLATLLAFAQQMIGGALLGLAGGIALTQLVNRLRLARSLYSLMVLAGGLFIYGAAALLGGSGFLAAYVGGLVLGNRVRTARRGIQRFHDGMAWLCQIGLFLMLGLLVNPSALLPLVPKALAVAATMTLVARPAAVALTLLPFRFEWRQVTFISWVGLRGAVPIVLSLFPLLAGVPQATEDFNVVFFVVLVSLLLQGWTVAPLARWLGLELPRRHPDARRIDVDAPPEHELVICELPPGCPALNATVKGLEPPQGVRLLSLVRDRAPVAVAENTRLTAGDLLYLLVPTSDPALQERLDHWLDDMGTVHPSDEQDYFGEFAVDAAAPMEVFAVTYLAEVPPDMRGDDSIGYYVRRRLRHRASEGDYVRLGNVVVVVREMDGGRITRVGVKLPKS
ncbi:MAG: potassium/proton antiporter [Ectothiorhodospiraceae bacterium]